ncbi:conserved hypothetical protein 374 [Methanococcus vannielii SB]|uniref:Lysylphosphatidylglycerol synthetase/UPF0104 n=1 Tax=Methanococcus vannielii (strain ATCC 35089 / DSM 1224 / JCM 13029 / OCM 148 / SB) TaxID=406327 RepID=A6URG9_METVS|nr:lysylphosphatidylglycerol synthase transmembrane domain-containing protein [Methanococcus vannielii]ABR55091.1 conserved hypothetical protein 374 [Methanococcus vannielii SB]
MEKTNLVTLGIIGFKKISFLILGMAVITAIALKLGLEDVYHIIVGISLYGIFFMVILQVISLFLSAYSLYILLIEKSTNCSMYEVFKIQLIGSFVESITPSVKLGGEPVKIYLLKQSTGLSYSELTAMLLVTKFYSLLSFLAILAAALLIGIMYLELPSIIYFSFAGLIGFLILFYTFFNINKFFPKNKNDVKKEKRNFMSNLRLVKKVNSFLDTMANFLLKTSKCSEEMLKDYKKALKLLVISSIVWMLYPLKVVLVAYLLGFSINPIISVIGTFGAYAVSMLPLFPGGLVSFEGTLTFILSLDSLMPYEAFSVSVVTRIITFWIPLIFSGIVSLNLLYGNSKK